MTDVYGHPWLGGLFGDGATIAALDPETHLSQMLVVESAHTDARRFVGDISDADAAAVAAVLSQTVIDPALLKRGTAADGLVIPALIAALKRQLPSAHHHALHAGLTSQDVIDTSFALCVRPVLAAFQERLKSLDVVLTNLDQTFGKNPLMGRTRMQSAQPIAIHDRIESWRLPLTGHVKRLETVAPTVLVLSLGGPVGTGQNAAIGDHMAKALGLEMPAKAPHAMREGLADLAGVLSLITGTLGKIGQDIALMAQQGVDAVTFEGGGASSAMSHKNNPIRAELLVTLARYNATQLPAMHHALVHEQERSGAAWALEWMILPQMIQTTGTALLNAAALIDQITYLGEGAKTTN